MFKSIFLVNGDKHPLLGKITLKVCDDNKLFVFGLLLKYLINNKNKILNNLIDLKLIEFRYQHK